MSKKSRKRNKKILAMLALAGGAAMMGRRGKGAVSTAGQPVGVDRTMPTSNWITKKSAPAAVVADEAPISKNIFRTRHRLTDSAGNTIPSTNKMANIAAMNAPKGIYPPGSVPMPLRAGNLRGFNRKDGGRIGAKKGGRVTGIAKRGFGRALMKGKK